MVRLINNALVSDMVFPGSRLLFLHFVIPISWFHFLHRWVPEPRLYPTLTRSMPLESLMVPDY